MKKKTVWTNQFSEQDAKQVEELLNQGYAVKVGADCIGHTRARMVECEAKQYFQNQGCKEVGIADYDGYIETYYIR